MYLQFLQFLEFPSSFPARVLPTLGSTDSANREMTGVVGRISETNTEEMKLGSCSGTMLKLECGNKHTKGNHLLDFRLFAGQKKTPNPGLQTITWRPSCTTINLARFHSLLTFGGMVY